VLKPLDVLPGELEWQASFVPRVAAAGEGAFRLATPMRTRDGGLVADGWTAWPLLVGRRDTGRWADIIAVGERLSAALTGLDRPSFIDKRNHAWAVADRVAWGEQPVDPFRYDSRVSAMAELVEPLEAESQLIHGDLTGNVLFADTEPPAIIDLSLYWRPPAFASAVVVADALVWEGADESILAAVAHVERFGQYLVRAMLFRLVTELLVRGARHGTPERYTPALEISRRLASVR
jgi:uncharacterized protein (TIGR02569 family)